MLHQRPVAKLCIFVGVTLGGIGFGWGATALGVSFFWAFVWSGVGSLVGCWAGWKAYRTYFE